MKPGACDRERKVLAELTAITPPVVATGSSPSSSPAPGTPGDIVYQGLVRSVSEANGDVVVQLQLHPAYRQIKAGIEQRLAASLGTQNGPSYISRTCDLHRFICISTLPSLFAAQVDSSSPFV